METTEVLHIENQTNKKETKSTGRDDTKNKLSNLCLDIAKYIFTGIFLAIIFALINNVMWMIFFSGVLVTVFVLSGIMLNKFK